MIIRLVGVAVAVALAFPVSAAIHDVSSPAEFQAALTESQSNAQDDTINVAAGT